MNEFRIIEVGLKNVKSFVEGRIVFGDGITVISGINGSGKSTIFEAIGHCLFGVSADKFIENAEQFIRHGEKNGSIEVVFIGADGAEYKVTKELKGNRILYARNPDGWFPVEGVNVDLEIKKKLGLSGQTALDKMFTDIIGPFQGEFVFPFIKTGRGIERKRHFDDILGISQWEELSKDTSWLENGIKAKIDELKKNIGFLLKQIEDLPEKNNEMDKLKENKKRLENILADLEVKIKEIEFKISSLESLERSLDEKKREMTKLSTFLDGQKNALAREEELLRKALSSREIVNKTRPGFLVYLEQEEIKKQLEKQKLEKNRISDEITALDKKISTAEQRIATERRIALENQAKNERQIAENRRQANTISQKLAEAKSETQKAQFAVEAVKKEIEKIQSVDIGIITRKIDAIKSDLFRIDQLERDAEKRKMKLVEKPILQAKSADLQNIEKELMKILDEISMCKSRVKANNEGKEALKAGICPFMGEECKNLGGREPGQFFDREINRLNARIAELENKKSQWESKKLEAMSARDLLAALITEEKELAKDIDLANQMRKNIADSITKKDIIDLYSSLSSISGQWKDAEIQSALSQLEKKVNSFSFPTEISQFPKCLDEIFRSFDSARAGIINRLKYQEKELEAIKHEKVGFESGYLATFRELRKQEVELEKSASEILATLQKLDWEERKMEGERQKLSNFRREVKKYDGIEDKIRNTDEILQRYKQDYELYNLNLKDSERVNDLTLSKEKLDNSIREVEERLSNLNVEIANLEGKFCRSELDSARIRVSSLKEERAKNKADITNIGQKIASLEADIQKMNLIVDEIKNLEKEIREYEESKLFAVYLRKNVLERIAGQVSRVIRDSISIPASQIYRQISGMNEELYWGQDYRIELRDRIGNTTRVRVDRQLSGGQFMTAVIALRLALLRTIGSSIAFFDEPTSNLDEERRKNLVEAFRNLDSGEHKQWYSQLFLVSHDESFQAISGNNVELELVNGESKVVSLVGRGKIASFK